MTAQGAAEAAVYFASCGSVAMVSCMLDSFGVDVDVLTLPGVCVECSPRCPVQHCGRGHGLGSQSMLMAACLFQAEDAVRLLCSRGAALDLRNEVGDGSG